MDNNSITQKLFQIFGKAPKEKELQKAFIESQESQILMRESLRKIASLVNEMEEIVAEENQKSNTLGNKIIGRSKEFSEKSKAYDDIAFVLRDILSEVRNI